MGASTNGQSLVEFCVWIALSVGLLLGISKLYRLEWDRLKCSYLVFEKTHQALVGVDEKNNAQVRIQELNDHFEGTRRCGNLTETLALKKLEAISW